MILEEPHALFIWLISPIQAHTVGAINDFLDIRGLTTSSSRQSLEKGGGYHLWREDEPQTLSKKYLEELMADKLGGTWVTMEVNDVNNVELMPP
jgi:hypothetical protein